MTKVALCKHELIPWQHRAVSWLVDTGHQMLFLFGAKQDQPQDQLLPTLLAERVSPTSWDEFWWH